MIVYNMADWGNESRLVITCFKERIFRMEYKKRALEQLTGETFRSFKCVLVTGARQTGKSTMLQKLFPDLPYITLDDSFIMDQANNSPRLFLEMNTAPVIIDEVQKSPGLFPFIKICSDRSQDKGQYCLSGSQPFALMKNVSESLAGRVGILELSPLSLRELSDDPFNRPFVPTLEYLKARSTTAKKPDNLWYLIHRGGYPEAMDPNVNWNTFYSSYVSTYLERDVRNLTAVQNLTEFRRFMVALAARTGEMLNYSNIADEIGKDRTTVRNWVSILEASGIVYILEPFAHTALKRAIKTPKIYFRDTGLAAYLTRWMTPETLSVGAMSGQFFESFVVSEILKSYSNCGIDYRYCVSYYRGKDKTSRGESEIDLIIEENGILYPVEIKKAENVRADQASAFQVLDALDDRKRGNGAIICNSPTVGALRDNLFAVPVHYI